MINLTLRNAVYLSTHQAQSPAEINLLVMSKESAIQSTGIPVIFRTDHHTSSRSPEYLLLIIILSVISLYGIKDSTPTERITQLIKIATACSSILKHILVVFGQQLRLASSYLRMSIHKLDERSKPMMRYLHITVQENIIISLYFFQGTVIPLGKAEVLLQYDGFDMRKLGLQKMHGLV